ncbi:Clp protease N-terminal domain-containing protein [Catenuloplanes japonicus]|uniref:Clp protease N-terminal domain-containing protein n=1 Tax=Catenuloplanes japonicus TaxID=33876 RepID=UPI000ACAC021|nr:Clp protease N-terminal domain-containing protein [Catenuloplanes japonicus]
MADEVAAGDRITGTIARARGFAAGGPIGTGHLLYAAAHDRETSPLLDAFEITPIVVRTVLVTPGRAAAEPGADRVVTADGEPAEGPFDEYPAVRDALDHVYPLSEAAAAALRAVTDDSRETLLAALLADPASEACAVVRDAGADPEAVLAGAAPSTADRLEPELRPARDALLCRSRYRGRGLKDRVLFSVLAREVNHAQRPVMWTRLEADRIAREQHRATRTDDVLLALLITHAVAEAYPHMSRIFWENYGGGDALRAHNLDHQGVRAAALALDGKDDVPPSKILVPGPDWTEDTRVLLDRLAAHPGNRSSRLLA